VVVWLSHNNSEGSLFPIYSRLWKNPEAEQEPFPAVGGAEVLAYLMGLHELRQSDLPEIGSQGVVSEILSGRRELNVRQIRALAERFGVSPAVFV
jgi:HTH-type transcriptional regulator/antitoxin HigA